jgi:FAD/FMN-containing dehydrogenase
MAQYKSAVELALMRKIKRAVDPQGLFNPGRLLPD